MVVDHWQFDSWRTIQHLNLTKSLIIQVPPQTSLSSNKPLLSPSTFGFSFPVLSPDWKVFLLTIFIIFWFFSHISSSSSGGFLLIDFLVRFSSPVSLIGLGDFLLATWSFETHQLPYGARMFSLVIRFSSLISHHLGWEVFHQQHDLLRLISFPAGRGCFHWSSGFSPQSLSLGLEVFHQVFLQGSHSRFPSKFPFNRFHAQRSSRLKREAIVITWPSEWKSCDNYQPQLHLIRFDFHHGARFLLIYATE